MSIESIAVIKISSILLVSVPADPDDETVTALQEKILSEIEKHQASGLILDISTVDTMDSFFARIIAETCQMVKLMGCDTVISGMHPSVAITTVQLGLTMEDSSMALNVDRALKKLNMVLVKE